MAHLLSLLVLLFLAVHVSHGSPLPPSYDGSMCSESFMCGGVDIRYPFYLSNATQATPDYTSSRYSCGYTDLKIFCLGQGKAKAPVLYLQGDSYTILDISYDSGFKWHGTARHATTPSRKIGPQNAVGYPVLFVMGRSGQPAEPTSCHMNRSSRDDLLSRTRWGKIPRWRLHLRISPAAPRILNGARCRRRHLHIRFPHRQSPSVIHLRFPRRPPSPLHLRPPSMPLSRPLLLPMRMQPIHLRKLKVPWQGFVLGFPSFS